MRVRLTAVLFTLTLVAAAGPAAALEAEALRQDLIDGLNTGLPSYSTEPFRFAGVETVDQGEAVRVTITGLALPLPELDGQLDLGDLSFTVAEAGPERGPGYYRVSEVEAESQASLVDKAGKQVALVNYRLERLTGIWSGPLRSFLDVNAAMRGFEVLVPEEQFGVALAEVAVVSRAETRGDGLTDMTGEGRARGLRVINPAFGTIEVAEMAADFESQGQDLDAVKSFADSLGRLNQRDTPPEKSELAAILDRLAQINMLPQGIIERFKLTGLTYLDPAGHPGLRIDVLEADVAAGDLHLPQGHGSLGLRVVGIEAEAPGGEAVASLNVLLPRNLGLIASVERLPVQPLWRQMLRGMALAAVAEEQDQPADVLGEAMGTEMLAAINGAKTALRLDRLDIETPTGRVLGQGDLQVDDAAALGVQGRLDLTITGLDEMIAVATGAAQSGQVNPELQGNMMFLMFLKSMVRRETGPDGKPIDRLEMLVTPTGEVLMNGQPFSMAPQQQ